MKDFIYIGSAPCDEECTQVGTPGYSERAKKECRALIAQIRRVLGNEPEEAAGTGLRIKGENHEYGTYYEVVCSYDDDFPESTKYAYRCEAECPQKWDEEAKLELGL